MPIIGHSAGMKRIQTGVGNQMNKSFGSVVIVSIKLHIIAVTIRIAADRSIFIIQDLPFVWPPEAAIPMNIDRFNRNSSYFYIATSQTCTGTSKKEVFYLMNMTKITGYSFRYDTLDIVHLKREYANQYIRNHAEECGNDDAGKYNL
jgi:hypothetical protein